MAAAPAKTGKRADGWDPTRSAAGSYSPWLIVAIISIPTFMEVLDTSIANVALDHIAGGLSVSNDQATWVLTSYLVANAIIIPISGWLSDVIGRKRYFMISIGLFTLSSLMCGLAPNLSTLVIARVLQGIGGGGLAPVEQSMLADTFPPRLRGMAFAAFAIVVVVGPVLGPTLGGYITENSSWHWVFLINVPIGIVSLFLVNLFVDEPKAIKDDRAKLLKRGIRVDYIGILLIALGLGFFELTLDRGEREDWFSSGLIITTATISALSLIALAFWETNHPEPVLDLKLLKNRNFSLTLLVMGVTGMILFGTTQLIPQMLQQVLGYTSFQAGLALTFGGVATLVMVPFAGRLSGVVDVRLLLFPALLVQAFALWNMTHLNADITFLDAGVARLYQAMGLPFLFVPISAVAYVGLPQNKTAQASSMLNVARNLGGSIGISASQTLLASGLQRHQSELVNGLSPLNPNYNEWLAKAGGAFGGVGDPTTTPLAVLYQTVQRQASMLAFLDVFHSLMIVVLCIAPVVFFMRSGKSGGSGGGMAH
ncbi:MULTISPECIES: DHA2 family efflux MFS transporter permease subunit [Sphingomonas]|uniref:EmrB/QacA family drug resistance transporter n=1 Tax=Sphingomonas glacialis TaxID=658225 RepID=A0ABQ3L9B2_9SPHN|nr:MULTISPECIES: DHA2 family efflux MFS transporter permease subunit [Sphingomonas]MDY7525447.1 DHA2 family efflux MFS transporter permease subunit [Sphingomonas sp. 10B4]MEB0281391.1 DHA2 family efflux MFS transporter permease subunit [Sphingomonas sp. 10B4]GHH08850.1 EmrB/QacA family drug resistance transporter [Sphingomonas glacialis]